MPLVPDRDLVAKGKGCSALMTLPGLNDPEPIFLGGIGLTRLPGAPDPLVPKTTDLEGRDAVALEWASNRFFGQHAELGPMSVKFSRPNDGNDLRSIAIVSPGSAEAPFPATLVNVLNFKLKLENSGVELQNRQPMILHSKSEMISENFVLRDLRVNRDAGGLPSRSREFAANVSLELVGVHNLLQPVSLHTSGQTEASITMQSSMIQVVGHYGLEVKLRSVTEMENDQIIEFDVYNLIGEVAEVRWYADGIGVFGIRGPEEGAMRLQPSGVEGDRATGSIVVFRRGEAGQPATLDDAVIIGACRLAQRFEDFCSNYLALRDSKVVPG